eukprot:4332397-Prymnesium_polylepis.2
MLRYCRYVSISKGAPTKQALCRWPRGVPHDFAFDVPPASRRALRTPPTLAGPFKHVDVLTQVDLSPT